MTSLVVLATVLASAGVAIRFLVQSSGPLEAQVPIGDPDEDGELPAEDDDDDDDDDEDEDEDEEEPWQAGRARRAETRNAAA